MLDHENSCKLNKSEKIHGKERRGGECVIIKHEKSEQFLK